MEVKGYYYFDLTIEDQTDVVKTGDLAYFYMEKNCGVAGVIFKVGFRTSNEKIKPLIIENNTVTIKVGESQAKAKTYKVFITEHNTETNNDDSTFIVTFVGTTTPMEFYTTRKSELVIGTSLDVIKQMSKEYLETDEVDAVLPEIHEDKKNWVRSYQTGAVTVLDAWLHMNIPNNTPLVWLDAKNKLHLRDLDTIRKSQPTWVFGAKAPQKGTNNYVQYLTNFTPKSYKFGANLVTGEKTIVNVSNVESGQEKVHVKKNKILLGSTTKDESGRVGHKDIDNKYQTENVHSRFNACYYENKYNLIQMSSNVGNLHISGFRDDIEICDFVQVKDCNKDFEGYYIVNTIVIGFGGESPIQTIVAVCRDNNNNIENSAITPTSQVNIHEKQMSDILQSIRNLRRATAMGARLLDGTTKRDILAYLKAFKYYSLSNFKVMGAQLNLNSSLEIMNSLKCIGNQLINSIIDKYIPYPYNLMLRNIAFEGLRFKEMLSKLLSEYLPSPLRELIQEVLYLLTDLKNLASLLHKQNSSSLSSYKYVSGEYATPSGDNTNGNASGENTPGCSSGGVDIKYGDDGEILNPEEIINNADKDIFDNEKEIPKVEDITGNNEMDHTQENTEKIQEITDGFVENTEGLDIPIPEVSLDETESLLPTDKLKESLAEKVFTYLNSQGYMTGIGKDFFIEILLGKRSLDFNTINRINNNVGNILYARYWGTYSGEITGLGTVKQILNKVVYIPNVALEEDIFKGDTIVINGTKNSNGQYTVVNVNDTEDGSQVTVLEDIFSYVDTPMITKTNFSSLYEILTNQEYKGTHNLTSFAIKGNLVSFIKNTKIKRIVVKGSVESDKEYPIFYEEGSSTPACKYDATTKCTYIYSKIGAQADNSEGMVLQVVIQTDSKTSVSKLANQDFTEFFVKNGFKDVYSTVPCTKIINALRGAKVWVAIPQKEHENVEFYINSTLTEMEVVEGVDLGLYMPGGASLLYNAYISPDTYNSNNVVLEIRKKQ